MSFHFKGISKEIAIILAALYLSIALRLALSHFWPHTFAW
jgi:hypothetical protein